MILTIINGQLTLPENLLKHLRLSEGNNVMLTPAPDGKLVMKAYHGDPQGISRTFGMLYDPDQPTLSLEEIKQMIEDGWAGRR